MLAAAETPTAPGLAKTGTLAVPPQAHRVGGPVCDTMWEEGPGWLPSLGWDHSTEGKPWGCPLSLLVQPLRSHCPANTQPPSFWGGARPGASALLSWHPEGMQRGPRAGPQEKH